MASMLSTFDVANLAEIVKLLDEAYAHYYDTSDGYSKPGEGHVSVSFGTYADRSGGFRPVTVDLFTSAIGSCQRHFDTTTDALIAVREWHADEMADGHTVGFVMPADAEPDADDDEDAELDEETGADPLVDEREDMLMDGLVTIDEPDAEEEPDVEDEVDAEPDLPDVDESEDPDRF